MDCDFKASMLLIAACAISAASVITVSMFFPSQLPGSVPVGMLKRVAALSAETEAVQINRGMTSQKKLHDREIFIAAGIEVYLPKRKEKNRAVVR